MQTGMIITIDGPAASGKSSAARALAQKLHYYYLNSGMLYRAVGYCLLNNARVPLDELAHADVRQYTACLQTLEYHYDTATGLMSIVIEKKEVTSSFLKDPVIDQAASLVGENKTVRVVLLHLQQQIGLRHPNLIAEGRDAGSVVFPQAELKFFLTAQQDVRALRWLNEQINKGNMNITFEQALQMIKERDERDINRPYAPLHIAADDIVIDNSSMDLAQTINTILTIIHKHESA